MLNTATAVRLAALEDVPALIPLMRALAAFEDYLEDFRINEDSLAARAFGPSAQCQIFVVDWLGKVAGYAVALEIPFTYDLRGTVLLKELYVADHCRGNGLGQALLQQVAIWSRARGAGRMKWDVMVGNDRAAEFYQRLGGVPDSKWIAYHMDSRAIEDLTAGC